VVQGGKVGGVCMGGCGGGGEVQQACPEQAMGQVCGVQSKELVPFLRNPGQKFGQCNKKVNHGHSTNAQEAVKHGMWGWQGRQGGSEKKPGCK